MGRLMSQAPQLDAVRTKADASQADESAGKSREFGIHTRDIDRIRQIRPQFWPPGVTLQLP